MVNEILASCVPPLVAKLAATKLSPGSPVTVTGSTVTEDPEIRPLGPANDIPVIVLSSTVQPTLVPPEK